MTDCKEWSVSTRSCGGRLPLMDRQLGYSGLYISKANGRLKAYRARLWDMPFCFGISPDHLES